MAVHEFFDGIAAADVAFTPAGALLASDVQAALVELDTEKEATGTAAAAVAAHSADTTAVHGIADTAALMLSADLPADVLALALTDFPAGLARDSEVAAAVAALVASAPGTLDTLDELAAALGDDANFAATTATALAARVDKSTYDADTILKADSDNTPSALAVAASTLIGRKAAGGIAALTVAEIKTLLALAIADVTGLQAALDAKVANSLFDANTILAATADNTPAALTVAASTFLGRKAAGNIAAMTVAEAKTLLALVIGDVTDLQTNLNNKTEAYTFAVTGTIADAVGKSRIYLEGNYELVSVRAAVGTAPVAGTEIFDVNKNGATIYGTQANRPTIAAAGNSALGGVASVTTFALGDYITVDIDSDGTATTRAADLTVTIRVRKVI